jgi:hypothetical protein
MVLKREGTRVLAPEGRPQGVWQAEPANRCENEALKFEAK